MVTLSRGAPLRGFAAPERFEANIRFCEVQGTIPSDMEGAFYRVGGEWFYPPKFNDDAPLNADGYVSMFRFAGGEVHYTGRWVQTERWRANHKAEKQLYGYYRNPYTDDPAISDPKRPNRRTVANTAPIIHAGKLFALKEDGLPHQLDPNTLETIGPWDFYGKWKSQTFTAHPKIDPVSGEMIAYGYEATGLGSDDLYIYTIDKGGRVSHEVRVKVPYVSVIHDMAVTQKHIIIPFAGYVTSHERLKEGKIHWGWDPAAPGYIGIIPRGGDAKDMRWFKGPQRCMMHTFNARTEGDKVIMEAPFWDSNFFPFFPNVDGTPFDPKGARALVRRLTFDLNSKDDGWQEEILFPMSVVDLGKVDPRYMTLPTRYGFTSYSDASRPFDKTRAGNAGARVTNCYGRFDFAERKLTSYFVGDTHNLQECAFVPRKNSTKEGDGYLIGVANNYAEMRSELIIADAANLAAGDIARVLLPFKSTTQVHGFWADKGELPFKAIA